MQKLAVLVCLGIVGCNEARLPLPAAVQPVAVVKRAAPSPLIHGTRPISEKDWRGLSVADKFAYCMLPGGELQSWGQPCGEMPRLADADKRVTPFPKGPTFDETLWSPRQTNFLKDKRAQVIPMLRSEIQEQGKVGSKEEEAIVTIGGYELIPDLAQSSRRERTDHSILSVCMVLMREGKYQPFLKSDTYKNLYGASSNYQSSVLATPKFENWVLDMAMAYYASRNP